MIKPVCPQCDGVGEIDVDDGIVAGCIICPSCEGVGTWSWGTWFVYRLYDLGILDRVHTLGTWFIDLLAIIKTGKPIYSNWPTYDFKLLGYSDWLKRE